MAPPMPGTAPPAAGRGGHEHQCAGR